MNVFYLAGFNNYYNRELKAYDKKNVSYFDEWIVKSEDNKNYNPNDNVNTTLTVNYTNTIPEYNISDDIEIDYVLVSEDGEYIDSKWFVIDRKRERKGQWVLSLRRDLLSDYYEYIQESPMFIEKGYISNIYNKLIYNNENILVNQIKQKEVLIKDKTKTPWIVGYLSKNYYEPLQSDNYYIYFDSDLTAQATYSASYSDYSNLNGTTKYSNVSSNQILSIIVEETYYSPSSYTRYYQDSNIPYEFLGPLGVEPAPSSSNITASDYDAKFYFIKAFQNSSKITISDNDLKNYLPAYDNNLDTLLQYNGKMIKNTDAEGPEYFTISVTNTGTTRQRITPSKGSSVYNNISSQLQNIINNTTYTTGFGLITNYVKDYVNIDNSRENGYRIDVDCNIYTITVSAKLPQTKGRVKLADPLGDSVKTKNDLKDAPYIMFCAPYYDVDVKRDSGTVIRYSSKGDINLLAASTISKKLGAASGSSYIYDLQLLPFCPISEVYDSSGTIDLTNLSDTAYSIITLSSDGVYSDANNSGILLFPSRSSFTDIITLSERIDLPSDPTTLKLKNDTEFCRIVSPNYAGAFEFNPMKNGGFSQVEINCTYKPYQPYIHINPKFNNNFLYGSDFNDNRGLICGGNFSLPQITDAWENYQIQNKSYMEAFNRQIENMETNNAVQREKELWSSITGGISNTIQGASLGYLTGGPAGAIAGGLGSGLANTLGAKIDIDLNDKLRAEGIDYTKDMFGYTLQNIKALPNTLSRVSSYDIDNKLFPFIEYYSCSDDESEAYLNKIKYNGMTVMAISTLNQYTDFKKRYVKGKLIKLLDNNQNPVCDMHETVEIASELMKGVFI